VLLGNLWPAYLFAVPLLMRATARAWRVVVGTFRAVVATFRAVVSRFRAVEATPLGSVLLGNLWPAYLFAVPLLMRAWGLVHMPRGGSLRAQLTFVEELVTVAFLGLVVVLFLIRRRQPRGEHAALLPGLVALGGTFLLSVVGYLPIAATTSSEALLASSLVVLVGTTWTIWSLATLGRCFGMLPEARGLVTGGPYRLVRHPVYVGEIVSAIGLLLAKPSVAIVLIFATFVGLQCWRTVYEERAMASAFPVTYPAYARRVGRLLPRVISG
jgi:protein-S-isoprenylcysteine O-methyltransferase Ste14